MDLQELYPIILDSITEGVFTVDTEFRITYFNTEAEEVTGFSREQALGRKCYEVLRADICQRGCAIRKSLETGEPQRDVRVTILNPEMEEIPISVSSAALRDRKGNVVGGVEIFKDLSEIETLRNELSGRRVFANMVGASPAMQELFRLIPDVAEADASVMIHGPSGTGKELVAQAIHDMSARSEQPYVRVNCGALPDTLLESELFGYVRGAFTDARKSKPGRFQQADKGTLFLDEVGDLSPAFQVKLLRAIQEGEVQPLGSTKTLRVDVRIITATNHDLKRLVEEGRFREDLFYRICVIPIRIPPLKERREDIIPILEHYVARLATRTGKSIRGISPEALAMLSDYDYPGNVRELTNILERAFALCHGSQIDLAHLPKDVITSPPAREETGPERSAEQRYEGDPFDGAPPRALKPSEHKLYLHGNGGPETRGEPGRGSTRLTEARPEARRLIHILNANGWNRGITAAALGISRSTLWRRMKEYGLL